MNSNFFPSLHIFLQGDIYVIQDKFDNNHIEFIIYSIVMYINPFILDPIIDQIISTFLQFIAQTQERIKTKVASSIYFIYIIL